MSAALRWANISRHAIPPQRVGEVSAKRTEGHDLRTMTPPALRATSPRLRTGRKEGVVT